MIKNLKIGVVVTGSHCTLAKIMQPLVQLREQGNEIFPVISNSVNTDTKFGEGEDWIKQLEEISGKKVIQTIVDAEPIGPKNELDVLIVFPCTGNTMAKLANAMTDNGAMMAIKAHLRNDKPVVLAIATNDALSQNAMNLGKLISQKNIYFVPFGQDDPFKKPFSMVADLSKLEEAIEGAVVKKQTQPIIIQYSR